MEDIQVISEEIIKPSSSTPDHLRHYQLSLLDQINPPVYTSLVLFFEFNGETQPTNITDISNHLKMSLAEVLTLYYPLAGRIRLDSHFVDCNDEGIPYLEAQVKNCKLSDVLNDPIPGELNKLVPFKLDDHLEFALGVQLNMFECGGFAIGLCTSHKLADGLSMLMFTKTWAAIAHGGHDRDKIERPEFVSASLFPPKEKTGYDARVGITENKITRRFVFNAPMIEDLRAKYTGLENNQKRPSRVETLSAFIWRRFMEATKSDDDEINKMHMVVHAVNLRPRMDPPLPRCSFGNIYRVSITAPLLSSSSTGAGDDDDDQESCYGMIRQVREAISKIDKEYVKSLQQGDEHLSVIKKYADSFARGQLVTSNYTSLCRFPLYDNDFGWGRPTWVGLPALTFKNLIIFLDTKEAGGVEAYVSLSEEAMAKFECDPVLQKRVGTSRVGFTSSSLTRQPTRFSQVAKFHTQSRSNILKKPTQVKPMKLGSGSVFFRLLIKLVKK